MDTEFGELLVFLPGLYRNGAAGFGQGKRHEFWTYASELAKQHPGLEKRNCSIERQWDQLHYLLSASRRGQQEAEGRDLLMNRAILGSKLKGIHGTQGVPVGYIPTIEVRYIALFLESLTAAELRVHYEPDKMKLSKVYKMRTDNPQQNWAQIIAAFEALHLFYRAAAASQEAAIAFLD